VRGGEVIVLDRPAPVEPAVPRDFRVLAEDESFLALDKPAGLPIHTTAKFFRNTLCALLRERYPGQPLQVCHRLDRETSGVLLVARGREASSSLKRAFARRAVSKRYLALVHGVPAPAEGVIDRPLKLLDTPTHLMMGVVPDGLPSLTRYRVVEAFARHALVEAAPETGRQHQIRVHLAAIGHPIVGDKLYRASERQFMDFCDGGLTPELLEAFDGLPRHALHAHRLTFPHPRTGAAVTVESPWPDELRDYVAALEPA
jgi:23S rRNA pseudouridine1911/1915/1917 synthase